MMRVDVTTLLVLVFAFALEPSVSSSPEAVRVSSDIDKPRERVTA